MSALHAAERDYEAICRTTPGITGSDVDLDLLRLQLIAAACAAVAHKAWQQYRATSDPGSRPEFDVGRLARNLTDTVADTLGFSREAAILLDEMAKVEFD